MVPILATVTAVFSLMTLSHAAVALLMPDYPTNEHLCDHVFITILPTSALLL